MEFEASSMFDQMIGDEFHSAVLLQLFLLSYAIYIVNPIVREPSMFDQRMNWQNRREKFIRFNTFRRRLRMSPESFDKLLSFIKDDLVVNEVMANIRGGPVIPELCLFCTLRWLAGGSYLDIYEQAGISRASFFRVIWKTMRAIEKCPELEIRWPQTKIEIERAMEGFQSVSTQYAIKCCMGVIDGYLLRITVPPKNVVGNQRAYFSGHYQCYGINVQAVSDHHSRFIYLAMAAPGVTGDRQALEAIDLNNLIEELPVGVCVIGDAAYEPTEHMVPIYYGIDRLTAKYDDFSYYASQCRIQVEMAFGMMQMKWGVLQRPLSCHLRNIKYLLQAIGRLHNFCINERLLSNNQLDPQESACRGAYLPTTPHDEYGDPIVFEPALNANIDGTYRGHSELREIMVERIVRLGLKRPDRNNIRKHRDNN